MTEEVIEKCIDAMRDRGVILYPTDTIWGLGCDATDSDAIDKIYRLKKRPFDKKCIVLMNSVEMLYDFTGVKMEDKFFQKFDTPTTLIVEVKNDKLQYCLSDENTLAFRIPNNEFCSKLVESFGKPIVSTSANISNEPNPSYFDEINNEIIDGADYVVSREYDTGIKTPSQILRIIDSENMKFEKLR